jgi:phosphohistidine phosphatase SixA
VSGFGSRSVIPYGAGPTARRAAHQRADELWAQGLPARAYFAVELGGWVVVVYTPFPESHVIAAAGGVPWRPARDSFEVALVHRPRYDDWSLPKGKLHAGEHALVGARREVTEEVGYDVVLGRRLPSRRYDTTRGPKAVDYWAMRAGTPRSDPANEVDEVAWLSTAAALRRLSYDSDVEVLDALGDPRGVSLVVLVRHASAGDPDTWTGDDRLRPLDAKGERQAEAVREVLALFGVTRVASVPNARCIDTVAGLAADLAVPVRDEPTVEETEYAKDPDAGRRRLLELAADSETWAVCSQGTVIPDLVRNLADDAGIHADDPVRAKKGSVWGLFFTAGGLVAADYYPELQ